MKDMMQSSLFAVGQFMGSFGASRYFQWHAYCNEPTPALFRSGCNGPEATIKSNSALSHILRRVVSG